MSDVSHLEGRRYAECAELFGREGGYSPRCCRFPKACRPYPPREALEAHADTIEAKLEPRPMPLDRLVELFELDPRRGKGKAPAEPVVEIVEHPIDTAAGRRVALMCTTCGALVGDADLHRASHAPA